MQNFSVIGHNLLSKVIVTSSDRTELYVKFKKKYSSFYATMKMVSSIQFFHTMKIVNHAVCSWRRVGSKRTLDKP